MQRNAALDLLADGLVGATSAAIARIWTLGPGDRCENCPMRSECADQTECLHLVKSAGASTRTDGSFSRFPLGARQVGKVPETLAPVVSNDDVEKLGLADPTWLMVHDVRAFAAVPLAYEGRCIGVAAVFARDLVTPERLAALQALASFSTALMVKPDEKPSQVTQRSKPAAPPPAAKVEDDVAALPFMRPFEETEKDVLVRVLQQTKGRVSGPDGAAKVLGLKPTTLNSRLKKLGISPADYRK